MSDSVQDRVLKVVETARQKPAGSITPDSTFEELEIDSLDRLNLLFDLEGEFDIQIDDEQAKTVTSLREMIDGIQLLVDQKAEKAEKDATDAKAKASPTS
ncbi:phosphopantetheine-binding protein [Granulicella tundricola]|uniref:Phosphopantetheine-binding protein n=1 Tax=Granulicella tundricola (strain ATCC BAA-1859 / DSM 23138 / MP5ACTX9) TaxID=1198114 RepID=E8X5L0_GRATM|nr:phosphopantetheine-binding protein [Granulicella tundricola]ADW70637.1 phosphopantetheine-binding protein [Granulicella tundricola MP5ACTX9]